jgi:hypothetical protein
LKQAAMGLGVSQYVIENEYYMVDIPEFLNQKAKQKNSQLLEQVMLLIATNNRVMEESDYKKFIKQLTNQAGIKPDDDFDRAKFEHLRMMTNRGINRTK